MDVDVDEVNEMINSVVEGKSPKRVLEARQNWSVGDKFVTTQVFRTPQRQEIPKGTEGEIIKRVGGRTGEEEFQVDLAGYEVTTLNENELDSMTRKRESRSRREREMRLPDQSTVQDILEDVLQFRGGTSPGNAARKVSRTLRRINTGELTFDEALDEVFDMLQRDFGASSSDAAEATEFLGREIS